MSMSQLPFFSEFQRYATLCLCLFICMTSSSVHAQFKATALNYQASVVAQTRLQSAAIPVTSSALVQYAAQGDVAVVDLLLSAGVSAQDPEPLRRVTALHNAAAQGHLKLVQSLIVSGALIDAQDISGATPLINAVYAGQIEAAKLLLQNKANANVVSLHNPSALNLAVQYGNTRMVELLLSSGASVDLRDTYGLSPRSTAQNLNRIEILKLLDKAASK